MLFIIDKSKSAILILEGAIFFKSSRKVSKFIKFNLINKCAMIGSGKYYKIMPIVLLLCIFLILSFNIFLKIIAVKAIYHSSED